LRKLAPVHLVRPSFLMALLMSVMGLVLFFGIVVRAF
jgi:hypothetical protein